MIHLTRAITAAIYNSNNRAITTAMMTTTTTATKTATKKNNKNIYDNHSSLFSAQSLWNKKKGKKNSSRDCNRSWT